jgi:lysozyme
MQLKDLKTSIPFSELSNDPVLCKEVQQVLVAHGFSIIADGVYNSATQNALVQFKQKYSLSGGNNIGPTTAVWLLDSSKKSLTPTVSSPAVGALHITEAQAEKKIPQQAINLIKEFEGCELDAYDDGVGVCTIGYGATFYQDGRKVQIGDRITQQEAEDLLRFHLKAFWNHLAKTTPRWAEITDGQRGALLSFSFNTGWTFGADGFNTLNKCIEKQSWDAVPAAISLYVNPGTSTESGLRRRRKAEGELWGCSLSRRDF